MPIYSSVLSVIKVVVVGSTDRLLEKKDIFNK